MDNKELEKKLERVEADTEDNIKFLQMVRDGDVAGLKMEVGLDIIPLPLRLKASEYLLSKQIPDRKAIDLNAQGSITLVTQQAGLGEMELVKSDEPIPDEDCNKTE